MTLRFYTHFVVGESSREREGRAVSTWGGTPFPCTKGLRGNRGSTGPERVVRYRGSSSQAQTTETTVHRDVRGRRNLPLETRLSSPVSRLSGRD